MVLTSHAIVGAIELAFYILVLLPTIHNLVHYGVRGNIAWLFLMIYAMVKITASSILLYVSTNPAKSTVGLETAVQILYSIALGPLLNSTLSFLNPNDPKQPTPSRKTPRKNQTPISRILRLVHFLVMVGIALGVTGGVERTPNSDGSVGSSYDSGANKIQVSAILILVAFAGIVLGAAVYTAIRATLHQPNHTLIMYVDLALPLLLIRVLYTLLGAFNLSTTTHVKPNTWNMFTGSVAAYVLMGMLTQFGVVVLFTVGGYVARKRMANEGGRSRDVEVGQEGYRMVDHAELPAR